MKRWINLKVRTALHYLPLVLITVKVIKCFLSLNLVFFCLPLSFSFYNVKKILVFGTLKASQEYWNNILKNFDDIKFCKAPYFGIPPPQKKKKIIFTSDIMYDLIVRL